MGTGPAGTSTRSYSVTQKYDLDARAGCFNVVPGWLHKNNGDSRMNTRVILLGLAAMLTAGTAAVLPAVARADSPADIILIRQAGQDLLAGTFGGLKIALDAKVDVKTLAVRADAMTKWMKVFPLQFPAGSDTGAPNKAAPTIWSDRAGFDKSAASFTEATVKLTELAKAGDTDGFAAQFKATADACGACHKDYRLK